MHQLIKKILLWVGFGCLLLFMADRILFFKRSFLEQTAAKIAYPFYQMSGYVSSKIREITIEKDAYEIIRSKYEKLKIDYLEMVDEVIKLRATENTYQNIKELVEFRERFKFENKLMAKILVKNISADEHYYLVNRGLRDGVKKDMVALYQHHLVGRVCEVYDFYSKIKLITDQHSKVSAYTSKTRAAGIVQGYNCINRCNVTYVSHLFTVQDNDLVISSGQGLIFPEGFCLGKIVMHTLKEKELYHHIQIEPIINLQAIEYCLLSEYVILPQF